MDVRVLRTAGNCGTCTPQDYLDHWSKQYLGEADPYHPYASPMFGELHGLPPMLIQVGGGETMLDDAALFALKAGRARCQVRQRAHLTATSLSLRHARALRGLCRVGHPI